MREIFSYFLPPYFSFCVFSDPQHQSSISPRSPKKPPPLNRYIKNSVIFTKISNQTFIFRGKSVSFLDVGAVEIGGGSGGATASPSSTSVPTAGADISGKL